MASLKRKARLVTLEDKNISIADNVKELCECNYKVPWCGQKPEKLQLMDAFTISMYDRLSGHRERGSRELLHMQIKW